ncbi:MAG TPA: DUF4384 domain-containing protein [Pyrinomonadaceae bacterium]|nr:DUF4384 domain-containing protein [Pyrinomonadaceae bacterium]
MRFFKIFLPLIIFGAFVTSLSAQEAPLSAKEEFEEYERNFSQVKETKASVKTKVSPPHSSLPKPSKKPTAIKNRVPRRKKQASSVGSPGMKIWLEKQTGCAGSFRLVAPTSVFKTGDCVRARFRLNFEGYLTIVNRGSSGSVEKIFPLENQSNKIYPKTDNFIPDNRGWEFYDQAGNENLFFIVSKQPLRDDIFREIQGKQNARRQSAGDLEVYDRDLKPRTEKNEVFILAGEKRLEKPLIFRLTLKHR